MTLRFWLESIWFCRIFFSKIFLSHTQQLQYYKIFNEGRATVTSISQLNINKEYENISGCDNSNEILKSYLISEKYLICKKESNHHRGTTIR